MSDTPQRVISRRKLISDLLKASAAVAALPAVGIHGQALAAVESPASPLPGLRRKSIGPLTVHPENPRYFADSSGAPVYLTGSNLGWELQDNAWANTPVVFDYNAYLDLLESHHHNFVRMWMVEHTRTETNSPDVLATPMPYVRTDGSQGLALDGLPKFNLDHFEKGYFDRLRQRVKAAGDRGMYVAVMLFQGHSVYRTSGYFPWFGHPFNAANNVNGIDGDPDGDGWGETQRLGLPDVLRYQEAYVREVVDAVGDLTNVTYEICNEQNGTRRPGHIDWQYHLIGYLRNYQWSKGQHHPIGISWERSGNAALFDSEADWVAPGRDHDEPPVADGSKVVVGDTDHIDHTGRDARRLAWRMFTRGRNTLHLDYSLVPEILSQGALTEEEWVVVRDSFGATRDYALRMSLVNTVPRPELSSTGFCLANVGSEYLVYQQDSEVSSVDVDLSDAPQTRRFLVEWADPSRDFKRRDDGVVTGGGTAKLTPPWGGGEAVLYLRGVGG